MKRYVIECNQFYIVEAGEDSEGEWVRYEDMKTLINAKPSDHTSIESRECNCFHMSELKEAAWICPAHGYKRL